MLRENENRSNAIAFIKLIKKLKYWLSSRDRSDTTILILLVLLNLLINHRLVVFRTMNFSDFHYFTKFATKDVGQLTVWKSSTELGTADPLIWRILHDPLVGLLARHTPLDYTANVTILLILPTIVLTPIAGYLLFKAILKNKLGALVSSLLFTYNTYFLAITTQGHLLLQTSAVMGAFSLYFLISNLSIKKSYSRLMIAVLFLLATSYLDIRMFYIFAPVSALIVLIAFVGKKLSLADAIKHGALYIILIVLLSAFWLLSFNPGESEALSRGLFGNEFWQLKYALTLYHPFWRIGEVEWFARNNSIVLTSWLLPLVAIVALIKSSKSQRKTWIPLWILVGLLGVFLSKQVDEPFGSVYIWLYNNLVGFSAFREATKFYVLTILSYSYFLGLFTVQITQMDQYKKYIRPLGWVTILCIIFVPVTPILLGSVGNLYADATYPKAYQDFNNRIESDNSYSRVLWIPSVSSWSTTTNIHPTVSPSTLIKHMKIDHRLTATDQIKEMIDSPLFQKYANSASIKYIAVPIREQNKTDPFRYYGDQREEYTDRLNKQAWLKKLPVNEAGLQVYINDGALNYMEASEDKPAYLSDSTNYALLAPDQMKVNTPLASVSNASLFNNYGDLTDTLLDTTSQTHSFTGSLLYLPPQNSISYTSRGGYWEFINSTIEGSLATNGIMALKPYSKTLASVAVKRNANYYASDRKHTYELRHISAEQEVSLGTIDGDLLIHEVNKSAFYDNSLKTIDKFSSCTDNTDSPFSYKATPYKDEHNSLELNTKSRKACVNAPLDLPNNSESILISFDYMYEKTNMSAVVFDFGNGKTIKEELHGTTENWHKFSRVVDTVGNEAKIGIKLYSYPSENTDIQTSTRFKNLTATSASLAVTIEKNSDPTVVYPDERVNSIDLNETQYRQTNIVTNSTFENELWQEKVADCNSYDNLPDIKMSSSDDAFRGKKSLELGTKRHLACTSTRLKDLREGAFYRLRFAIKTINNASGGINISFNDSRGTTLSFRPELEHDNKWQVVNYYFQAPYSTTDANLTLYSFPENEGLSMYSTRYDDVSVMEVPNLLHRLITLQNNFVKISTPNITTKQYSNVKKTIVMDHVDNKTWLAMSESYHPKWQARVNGGPTVASANHFKLNGWQNGWYIDPATLCKDNPPGCTKNADGSYNLALTIEFTPQRWFNIGMVISGTTLLACVGYLGYDFIRNRQRRQQAVVTTTPAIGRSVIVRKPLPTTSALRSPIKKQRHPLLHRRKNRVYRSR